MVQCPGSEACRRLGNKHRTQDCYAQKELQGVCNGPSCLGEKNPGPAGTTSAFPQAFAVPLPGCCFLTLFNVLLHIMEGTTGTLERILEFSQACTVFVVEVREHPREQSCGSLCVSKAVFVFPVRTSSAWWIPRDCNAMPVNMH